MKQNRLEIGNFQTGRSGLNMIYFEKEKPWMKKKRYDVLQQFHLINITKKSDATVKNHNYIQICFSKHVIMCFVVKQQQKFLGRSKSSPTNVY